METPELPKKRIMRESPGGRRLAVRTRQICSLMLLMGGLTCGTGAAAQHRADLPGTITNSVNGAPGDGDHGLKLRLPPPEVSKSPSVPAMLLGGVAGGAVGLIAGAYGGVAVERAGVRAGLWRMSNEYVPAGLVWGALLGESLLLPLGVHAGGGGRGSYWRSAATSIGVMGAGLLLAIPTSGVSLLFVPPVQLGTSIHIEQRSAARNW